MKFARNLDHFGLSAVSDILAQVRSLRAAGRGILDLSVGEPDFDTPGHIREAAHRAALAGDTRYTAIDGTAALKEAVCRKFHRDNGLGFAPEEVSVGTGARSVLHTALSVLVDPDDEVILLTPAWESYGGMLDMLRARKVLVRGEPAEGFRVGPEALREGLSRRTRAVILNAPSNPAGVTYSRAQYGALAGVLRDFPEVWVISDEIYEHILFTDEPHVPFLGAAPDFRHRTITVNGVSKAWAMTGWRIGWAGAPADVVRRMRRIISNTTSSPCSISQAAAAAALDGPQDGLEARNLAYRERRDMLLARLADVPGLELTAPGGAFYLYPGCGGLLGRVHPRAGVLDSSLDIVRALLQHHGLAAVHGAPFFHDPAFRISFAASRENLAKATAVIREFVDCLR